MKKLAVFTLFLLSASTALADKGRVTVTNNGNHEIDVYAWDWDDSVRSFDSMHAIAQPGQTVTVTCVKGLLEPDSPGCQIRIDDRVAINGVLWGVAKKETGSYVFGGTWDLISCGAHESCVSNKQNITLDTPTVTPPDGAVSLSKTFDMPKPAASSTILETGNFQLAWQDDGNLVVYKDGSTPVWASNTNGTGAGFYFGSGGDLKICGSGGFNDNKWSVPTYKDQDPDGLGGDRLFLFPNGNLLVLNSNNRALWQTGAAQ